MVYSSYDSMYDHINYGLYLLTVVKILLLRLMLPGGYSNLENLPTMILMLVFDVLWIFLKLREDIVVFDWFSNFEIIYLLSSFVLSIIFFNDRFCKSLSKRKLFFCLLSLIVGIYLLINNLCTLYDEFNYYSLSLAILIILLCYLLIRIINKISYDSLQYYKFLDELMDDLKPDESRWQLILDISGWVLSEPDDEKIVQDLIDKLKILFKNWQDEVLWATALRKYRKYVSGDVNFNDKLLSRKAQIFVTRIKKSSDIMNAVNEILNRKGYIKESFEKYCKDSEIKSKVANLDETKVANLDKIIKERYSDEYKFLTDWKGWTGSVAELIILTKEVLYDTLYREAISYLMGMVDQSDLKISRCSLNLLRKLSNVMLSDDLQILKDLIRDLRSYFNRLEDEGVWVFVLRKIATELPIDNKEAFRKDVCSETIKQLDDFQKICLSLQEKCKIGELKRSNWNSVLKGYLIKGLDDLIRGKFPLEYQWLNGKMNKKRFATVAEYLLRLECVDIINSVDNLE